MFEDEEEQLIDNRKQKDELRAILDKHIAEYLARGGKIRQMEFGAITENITIHAASFNIRNEKVKYAPLYKSPSKSRNDSESNVRASA